MKNRIWIKIFLVLCFFVLLPVKSKAYAAHTHTDDCYAACQGIDYNGNGIDDRDDYILQSWHSDDYQTTGTYFICRKCGNIVHVTGGNRGGGFSYDQPHKRDYTKLICGYTLASIAATNPNQTVKMGESIITTATETYANGRTDVCNCSYSGFNTNSLGTQQVTLSYTENGITKTTQITVNVTYNDSCYAMCNGIDYNGDGFINDTDCDVYAENNYTYYRCRACGAVVKAVSIQYGNVTTYPHNRNYSKLLYNATLNSITALRPYQSVNKGKPISTLATATFSNGVSMVVECTANNYNTDKLAVQTVTLAYTYQGVTKSTPVTVNVVTGHTHVDDCYSYCIGIDYNGDGQINDDDLEVGYQQFEYAGVYTSVCRSCGAKIHIVVKDSNGSTPYNYPHLRDMSVPTCLEYTITPSCSFFNVSGNTVLSDMDNSIPLKINLCDNENDTLTCNYYLDGNTTPSGTVTVEGTKPQKTVEFPTPINVASLSEGNHTLKVTISDNISPTKEISLTFRVDKSAPIISSTTVEALTKGAKIKVSASDSVSELAPMAYRYTIDNKTSEWLTSKTYKIKNLNPGTSHSYRIEVRDGCGHSAVQTGNFVTRSGQASSTPYRLQATSKTLLQKNKASAALNSKMYADSYNETDDNTDLEKPMNITAKAKSQTKVQIQWDASEEALDYELRREMVTADGLSTVTKTIPNILNTYYTDNRAQADTVYYYSVRSQDQYGKYSEWSDIAKVKTFANPPAQVKEVTGAAIGSTLIISWDKVKGAEGYDVKVSCDGNEKKARVTTNNAVINTERNNSQCEVAVSAYNDAGNGKDSSKVIVYTLAEIPTLSEITPEQITCNSIQAQWDVNGNPETVSYILDVFDGKTHTQLYDEIKDLPIIDGSIICTITDLIPGTEYTFKVRACSSNQVLTEWSKEVKAVTGKMKEENEVQETVTAATGSSISLKRVSYAKISTKVSVATGSSMSMNTDEISVIKLSIPQLVAEVTGSAIIMKWNKSDQAAEYQLEEDGKVIYTGADTQYIRSGLKENSKHVYRIQAESSGNYSGWSKPMTVVITKTEAKIPLKGKRTLTAGKDNLNAPLNVICEPAQTVNAATGSAIQISWDKVKGATSYEIIDSNHKTYKTDVNNITIENLTPGTEYKYRVRAVNKGNVGKFSNWVSIIPVVTVPNNVTIKAENGKVMVRWDNTGGVDSYQIEVDGKILKPVKTNYYEFNYSDFYMRRTIRVRACNGEQMSDWTKEVIFEQGLPLTITTYSNEEFTVMLPVNNVECADLYKLTLTYNPNELELVDACDLTREEERKSTYIEALNAYVEVEQTGEKESLTFFFKDNKDYWTGIAGRIKMRSKKTGTVTLNYGVSLKDDSNLPIIENQEQ